MSDKHNEQMMYNFRHRSMEAFFYSDEWQRLMETLGIGNPVTPTDNGTYLIDGGQRSWVENFDFIVSAANYKILGTEYHADQTNISLSEADPTLSRIDVFAVNTDGEIVVVEGTPDASPVKPYVDPETQLELGFVLVGAAATQPSDGYIFPIFTEDESPDFLTTESHSSVKSDSVVSPRTGTTSIEFTSSPVGAALTLRDDGTPADAYLGTNLTFHIKSKGSWGNNTNGKRLIITLLDDSDQVIGAPVVLRSSGTYGFDSSNTSDYQQVSIPISDFVALTYASATNIYGIKFAVSGNNGSIGFYMDDITLNLYKGGVNSGRFGVENEDNVLSQDRSVDFTNFNFAFTGLAPELNPSFLLALDGSNNLKTYTVPQPENPFTTLMYKVASLNSAAPVVRYFTHNAGTIVIGNGVVSNGAAPGAYTMSASDFSFLHHAFTAACTGNFAIQFPTAANINSIMAALTPGSYFDYAVSNDGAGSVTYSVNTGVVAASALTGGDNLVVATGTTAVFRFVRREGNNFTVSRIV